MGVGYLDFPDKGILNKITFTSNDTWEVPEGVTAIWVNGVGGGGGGAAGDTINQFGGGGGGGSTPRIQIFNVNEFDVLTINVGTAGGGGNFDAAAGGAGGNSTVTGPGVSWTAYGGRGAPSGREGAPGTYRWGGGGRGGFYDSGNDDTRGFPGPNGPFGLGGACPFSGGGSVNNAGGGGGCGSWGNGGDGGDKSTSGGANINGTDGGYGAGGGGGAFRTVGGFGNGGSGGSGLVEIYWVVRN